LRLHCDANGTRHNCYLHSVHIHLLFLTLAESDLWLDV
jgi:hypothetical protein